MSFDADQQLTPQKIVAELDRHIIGQEEAKKAVAIALRNRWRRMLLPEELREEIVPKNILMTGTTGVGKTEIARRLAKLVQAPFIKVEATKFTEIGYVGRDVEQIIRDLMEIAINMITKKYRSVVSEQAKEHAEERILDALTGMNASPETRLKFKQKLHMNELDDSLIEINVSETSQSIPSMDIPGMPGAQMGMINLGDMFSQALGKDRKTLKKMSIKEAMWIVSQEEEEKLIDQAQIVHDAIETIQQNGIVFIDEIDKICMSRSDTRSSSISQEGVQRDLLPLIEGTTVSTKYGQVKTDHILFIASGAFQITSPSDLLPELQGRFPIRVSLKSLTKEDFIRILKEPEANLICQAKALLKTENVQLEFEENAIEQIASLAVKINSDIENIGARRLYTIVEKVLEDFSFDADQHAGETIHITDEIVKKKLEDMIKTDNLNRFIL